MQSWQEFLYWEHQSKQTIDFKMVYVDITGDLIAGLMLSQIIYWHLPTSEGKSKLKVIHDGKYWLARRDCDWYSEIRITKDQARRARQILAEKCLIEEKVYKFNGIPTTHMRINQVALMTLLNKAQKEYELEQKRKEQELEQSRFVSEHNSICVTTQMEMGYNPNGNGLQPKSITESTTENTTKIKDQYIVHQDARVTDQNQLSIFDLSQDPVYVRFNNNASDDLICYRESESSFTISNVSNSDRSDVPAACGKVDNSGKKVLPRGGHAPDAFAAFWAQYPVKKGKVHAQTAWNRLKANSELVATIMHDLSNRKQNDRQWAEGYITHPATYLNGRRWEDEIEPLTNKKTGVKSKQDQSKSDETDDLWAILRGEQNG